MKTVLIENCKSEMFKYQWVNNRVKWSCETFVISSLHVSYWKLMLVHRSECCNGLIHTELCQAER